ncbi:MAG TPA: DinB family protein [Gemmatimonadaceae bacterium]|nr:DinB family protein [Gemmatimonadaceae bacterium]
MRLVALIAASCLPFTLSAQQTSTASAAQPNGVARTFLSFGQPYGGWLLMAFDSIPASQYGFRPTPVQQSIGFIAQHLETANYELCSTFGAEKHIKSAKDALPDTVKARWPKDTLTARVRRSLEFCAAQINRLSDAQLADTMTANTAVGPQTVLRARYLILLVTDLAEHYAQISGYMRILGMVPPSALARRSRD